MEPYLGQIMIFAGNFAPRGWALCDGRLMSIAQYSALFSILGTTYGGDGVTTFALPDLRGRVPTGTGTPPGIQEVELGEAAGSNSVTLLTTNLPSHSHALHGTTTDGDQSSPSGNVLATFGTSVPPAGPYSSSTANAALSTSSVGATGGNIPVDIMQPFLGLTFCIALEGVYPSRG